MLINCISSLFASKKENHHSSNRYDQLPSLSVDVRGPEPGRLIEINNAINKKFNGDKRVKVFSQVINDVQHY